MVSNGDNRGALLSAGGVLSIIAGISQIISGSFIAVFAFFPDYAFFIYSQRLLFRMLFMPFLPDAWWEAFMSSVFVSPGPVLFLMCTGVLGIVAIVGGVSAIRRKWFGLSMAGAVGVLPSVILGILAVIFVALGKREFGARRK